MKRPQSSCPLRIITTGALSPGVGFSPACLSLTPDSIQLQLYLYILASAWLLISECLPWLNLQFTHLSLLTHSVQHQLPWLQQRPLDPASSSYHPLRRWKMGVSSFFKGTSGIFKIILSFIYFFTFYFPPRVMKIIVRAKRIHHCVKRGIYFFLF